MATANGSSSDGMINSFCALFRRNKDSKASEAAKSPEKTVQRVSSSSGNIWTFKDAPKQPAGLLKLTLKHKSHWEKFKSAIQELPRQHALRKIEAEKQKILQEAYKRGSLTPDNVDFFNKAMREEVEEVFGEFRKNLEVVIKIEPNETTQSAIVKVQLVRELTKWLEDLIQWLNEELTVILSKIEDNGPRWCIQQAETLFQKLYVLFTEYNPEPAAEDANPHDQDQATEEGEDALLFLNYMYL